MYKKTIKYTDFNGVERESDCYFNLTRTEIAEMQLTNDGGLQEKINRIIKENDQEKIVKLFQDIILKAYGVKSDDGLHFYKSDKIREDFRHTAAYDELFMELSSNAESAAEFVNRIVPAMPEDHKDKSKTSSNLISEGVIPPVVEFNSGL